MEPKLTDEQINRFASVSNIIATKLYKEDLSKLNQGQIIDIIMEILAEKFPVDDQAQEKIDQLTEDRKILGDKYNNIFKDREGLRRRIEELEANPFSEEDPTQDSKILDLIQKAMEMR